MNQCEELEQGIAAWLGSLLSQEVCPLIQRGTVVPDEGVAVAAIASLPAETGAFRRCRIRVAGSFAERSGALALTGIGEREMPRFGGVFGSIRLAALLLHEVEESAAVQSAGALRYRTVLQLEAAYLPAKEVRV